MTKLIINHSWPISVEEKHDISGQSDKIMQEIYVALYIKSQIVCHESKNKPPLFRLSWLKWNHSAMDKSWNWCHAVEIILSFKEVASNVL